MEDNNYHQRHLTHRHHHYRHLPPHLLQQVQPQIKAAEVEVLFHRHPLQHRPLLLFQVVVVVE